MERTRTVRRGRGGLAQALTLGLVLAGAWSSGRAMGQATGGADERGLVPLAQALRDTASGGRPTVVIATSASAPASIRLRDTLAATAASRGLLGALQFTEMPAEAHAARLQAIGVKSFPTVMVYRRGAGERLELAGVKSGPMDAHFVLGWLGGLAQAQPSGATDPAIRRAGFEDAPHASSQAYPSMQSPPPVPKMAPPSPPTPYTPPAYTPPPYAPPAYAPPAYAPQPAYMAPTPAQAPVYIQQAPPTMVVQQQPQQIVLAPTPPPQITVLQAPMMAYAPTTGSAPMVPNLLAPAPTGSAPPQPGMAPPGSAPPQPGMAPPGSAPPAMAPVAMAPQPQPAMAPVGMAPQQQVGQSPVGAAILTAVLTNPNLIDRLLGTIGEHLAQKKNPRVQLGQSPFSQAPVGQSPVGMSPVGFAPTGYAPQAYGIPYGQAPQAYGVPFGQAPQAYGYPAEEYGRPCPEHEFCRGHSPSRGPGFGHGHGTGPGYGPGYGQDAPAGPTPTPQSPPSAPHKHGLGLFRR